jgi:hypothetical protein
VFDVAAQVEQSPAHHAVGRATEGLFDQGYRPSGLSGPPGGFRRGMEAAKAFCLVGTESRRAFVRDGGRTLAVPLGRSRGGVLERLGDVLVGSECRGSQVPSAALCVRRVRENLRQEGVGGAALGGGGRVVDGGTDERMPELQSVVGERYEARVLGLQQ